MAGRGGRLTTIVDLWAAARLAKLALSAFIALTTLFGAILAAGLPTWEMLPLVAGVFFVTTGGATLNSWQERRLDGTMRRTSRRPLPSGQLSSAFAMRMAIILISGGLLLLAWWSGPTVLMLTLAAVLVYNGLYTPLKQRTSLAIIPGMVSGALPPYIGWLGGGGEASDFPGLLLLALLVLWQVPHFHLILLENQDDYRQSTLPHLLGILSESRLRRLFVPWIGALACTMMMFAVLPQPMAGFFRGAVVVNGLLLVLCFFRIGSVCRDYIEKSPFFILNLFLASHMGLVAVGRMMAGSG